MHTYIFSAYPIKIEITLQTSASTMVVFPNTIYIFLLLLNRFGFDVIYINPLKDDENFALVDSDQISTVHKNTQILPIQSWAERAKNGQIIRGKSFNYTGYRNTN